MLYPTWKISKHWVISGAIDVNSRPYFQADFTTQGYGLKVYVIQANIGYSNVWKNGSVLVRTGQLSSAFGAFLLRYDDAENPLLNMPMEYGYYYAGVTTAGLAGAQVDVTQGKWDGRVQLVSSSPADPRSIFENGQYPELGRRDGATRSAGDYASGSPRTGDPTSTGNTHTFFRGESRSAGICPRRRWELTWNGGAATGAHVRRMAALRDELPRDSDGFREDAGYFEAKEFSIPDCL